MVFQRLKTFGQFWPPWVTSFPRCHLPCQVIAALFVASIVAPSIFRCSLASKFSFPDLCAEDNNLARKCSTSPRHLVSIEHCGVKPFTLRTMMKVQWGHRCNHAPLTYTDTSRPVHRFSGISKSLALDGILLIK